jgi:hypothetical protein
MGIVVHTVIPTLRSLRQEDCEFKASLEYRASYREIWAIW